MHIKSVTDADEIDRDVHFTRHNIAAVNVGGVRGKRMANK